MDRSRREVLGSVAGSLLFGFSGCVLGGQSTEGPTDEFPNRPTTGVQPDSTSTETPTVDGGDATPLQTPGSPENLLLSAAVVSQAADGEPARIEVAIENADDRPIEVRFGPTLLYTDNSEDTLEWADEIVLDPDTYIGPWDDPFQTEDDCWRYPSDGEMLVQSIAEVYRLEPGDSYSERYDVLTIGRERPCLPEGVYRFQDLGYTGGDNQVNLLFTVDVTIDSQQVVAADSRIGTVSGDEF